MSYVCRVYVISYVVKVRYLVHSVSSEAIGKPLNDGPISISAAFLPFIQEIGRGLHGFDGFSRIISVVIISFRLIYPNFCNGQG